MKKPLKKNPFYLHWFRVDPFKRMVFLVVGDAHAAVKYAKRHGFRRYDFAAFREWALSHGWHRGLQIDRIDDAQGYSPGNCRIVTCKENNDHRNSPRNAKGQYMGKSA